MQAQVYAKRSSKIALCHLIGTTQTHLRYSTSKSSIKITKQVQMDTQWKCKCSCINTTISLEPEWNYSSTMYCIFFFIFINCAVPDCIIEKTSEIRNVHILSWDTLNKWSWNCSQRCKNKERWQSVTVFTLMPALSNNLWSPLLLSLFYIAQFLLAVLMFLFYFSSSYQVKPSWVRLNGPLLPVTQPTHYTVCGMGDTGGNGGGQILTDNVQV